MCEWKDVEIEELSVMKDHVHLVVIVPPKVSISELMGFLKGKTAIGLFKTYRNLRRRPYWGNHFWSRGYCVTTIGLDEEKIRRYVRYQENKERLRERMAKWEKQSHVVYQCSYHIVWCPKYRFRIIEGAVAKYVEERIRVVCEWKDVEIEELSVMKDHVHLVVIVPPKVSISEL